MFWKTQSVGKCNVLRAHGRYFFNRLLCENVSISIFGTFSRCQLNSVGSNGSILHDARGRVARGYDSESSVDRVKAKKLLQIEKATKGQNFLFFFLGGEGSSSQSTALAAHPPTRVRAQVLREIGDQARTVRRKRAGEWWRPRARGPPANYYFILMKRRRSRLGGRGGRTVCARPLVAPSSSSPSPSSSSSSSSSSPPSPPWAVAVTVQAAATCAEAVCETGAAWRG